MKRSVSILTNNLCCDQLAAYYTKVEKYFTVNGWRIRKDHMSDYIVIIGCGPFDLTFNLVKNELEQIKSKKYTFANVIVMGCITKTFSDNLNMIFDGTVIQYGEENRLDEIFKSTVCFNEIETINVFKKPKQKSRNDKNNLFAILIAEGCFMKCTYCIINRAYGKIRSKPVNEIETEYRKAILNGYRNIELIGTDISIYGVDIGTNIVELMNRLLNIDSNVIFYLSNFNANWLDKYADEFVDLANKIAYVHMPIQHANDDVLKRMGRQDGFDFIYGVLKRMKEINPDIYFNTDLICGFPGETQSEFDDLLEFVKNDTCFSNYTINYYFDNPSTVASQMDNKISTSIKILRRDELKKIANTKINITEFKNKAFKRHKLLRQLNNDRCYYVKNSYESIKK